MTIIVIGRTIETANMIVVMNESYTIVQTLIMNSKVLDESSLAFLSLLSVFTGRPVDSEEGGL